ncbi:hypothetical protein BsWGS_03749 [Bradybaena similaris]
MEWVCLKSTLVVEDSDILHHVKLEVGRDQRIGTIDFNDGTGRQVWDEAAVKKTAVEMEKRRRQIQQACRHLDSSDSRLLRAIVSVPKSVVYCAVEKTASTFFRRYMYQLDHTDPMRTPFEVPVKLIYNCPNLFTNFDKYISQLANKHISLPKNKNKNMKKRKALEANTFLQKSINFLFVRDPYSRLFSAYIDKLFAPNPDFWRKWGKPAIHKHRKNATRISSRCGHDATFEEFLLFVLDLKANLGTMDEHLRPMTELCQPCNVNYTVVGHMNTFNTDLSYLSSLLNVTHSQLQLHKMADDQTQDAIEDSIMDAFSVWTSRIVQCLPKLEAGKRVWAKLQYRGIVSERFKFPLDSDPKSFDAMDVDDFIQMAKSAVKVFVDPDELHRQKEAAITNAYRTVRLDVLEAIAKMYAQDFKVFGFNDRPSEIFYRSV